MDGVYIYAALAFFDGVLGLLLVLSLVNNTSLSFPRWHRFFVSIAAAGLLSQSVLLIAYINGHSVAEFWRGRSVKDIYAASLALTYFIIAHRSQT